MPGLRFPLALLFGPLLALGGACQHPCQVDPGQCPPPALEVHTTPSADYPWLIQRLAPGSVMTLKVTGQHGEHPDEISVYFCAAGSACRDGCDGYFKPDLTPEAAPALDEPSQSYEVRGSALGRLPLGPTRLCASGRAVASQDVYVINRLLSPSASETLTFPMSSGFAPVSFDLARDQGGTLRAFFVEETSSKRTVEAFSYSSPGTKYPIEGLGDAEENPSLRAVSVGSDLFLIRGTRLINDSGITAPYLVGLCPLLSASARCSTARDERWQLPATEVVDAVAGDALGKRILVSLRSGPSSLRAFPAVLQPNPPPSPPTPAALTPIWSAEGPVEPLLLLAGPLFSPNQSDVVAVAKTAPNAETRDVRMFRAADNGGLTTGAVRSGGLVSAIAAALGAHALTAAASGDLDGDGLAEVVLLSASQKQLHILFNEGNGRFRIAGRSLSSSMSMMPDPEQLLGAAPLPADPLDLKVVNVDDPQDASRARPELVILSKPAAPDTALLLVLRLE